MMSRNGPLEGPATFSKGAPLQLTVETLMGTSFEIKACPHDTVTMLKNKIQTTEGIPASQQHLLYDMKELEDRERLSNYPISSGATLKLIVSMRVGPISTKRAPEVDELAWRELQELISDTPKDDLINRLPPKTKLTVLIYQDGEQVNFLKVLENEDGTFSPMSNAWNGSSFRTLFSKTNASQEDSEDSDSEVEKKVEEDPVTMGKVQDLQEKLEALSIHKKERPGDLLTPRPIDTNIATRTFGSKTDSQRSVRVVSYLAGGVHPAFPGRFGRRSQKEQEEDAQRARALFPTLFYPKMFIGRNRVKKEVEKITQIYKAKKVTGPSSESSSSSGLKRPPLPEIRRSSSSEKDKAVCEEEKLDDKVREKTATSFAIVEEENAAAPAPICSSQSSVVALPATEEVAAAVALPPAPAEKVTPTVTRSILKVSSYVLDDNETPKTVTGKSDERKGAKSESGKGASKEGKGASKEGKGSSKEGKSSKQKSTNYTRLFRRLSRMVPVTKVIAVENGKERELKPEEYAPPLGRNAPKEGESSKQPVVKKRVRCTQCKKKLNITNTYYCRCGDGPFCGEHRYSEAHDCAIDYRMQGRRVIKKSNPLVAPSKLPRI